MRRNPLSRVRPALAAQRIRISHHGSLCRRTRRIELACITHGATYDGGGTVIITPPAE